MEDKLPLNPDKEIFKWGPAPVKPFYADCLEGYFYEFPKIYPSYSWPKVLLVFKDNRVALLH